MVIIRFSLSPYFLKSHDEFVPLPKAETRSLSPDKMINPSNPPNHTNHHQRHVERPTVTTGPMRPPNVVVGSMPDKNNNNACRKLATQQRMITTKCAPRNQTGVLGQQPVVSADSHSDSDDDEDDDEDDDSELIDLTKRCLTNTTTPKTTAPSDIYDADIDYMNNYLKSLPDYTELNQKIHREFQKCEEMYDQLQSIRNHQPLAKSTSLQSVMQYRSPRTADVPAATPARAAVAPAKILRSTSSSVIPLKVQPSPAAPPNHDFKAIGLTKSTSSTGVNKEVLNTFWSNNIAKTQQQRGGWNYHRIMSSTTKTDSPPAQTTAFPIQKNVSLTHLPRAKVEAPKNFAIQKNMSLTQLDKRVQPEISGEQFYSLICSDVQINKPKAPAPPPNHQSKLAELLKPLTKSISHTSLGPMFASTKQSTIASNTPAIPKSSSKSNIPGIFRPLCKSTSNMHVFRHNPTPPAETFTQRTTPTLVKSSSSSCVPLSQGTGHIFLRRAEPTESKVSPAHQRISDNHELLKNMRIGGTKPEVPTTEASGLPSRADGFFVKKPAAPPPTHKVVYNYPPPFTKVSTIQIPINGRLPSALDDPVEKPAPLRPHPKPAPMTPAMTAATAAAVSAREMFLRSQPSTAPAPSLMRSASGNLNNRRTATTSGIPSTAYINQQQQKLLHTGPAAGPSYPCAVVDSSAPRLTYSASSGHLHYGHHPKATATTTTTTMPNHPIATAQHRPPAQPPGCGLASTMNHYPSADTLSWRQRPHPVHRQVQPTSNLHSLHNSNHLHNFNQSQSAKSTTNIANVRVEVESILFPYRRLYLCSVCL